MEESNDWSRNRPVGAIELHEAATIGDNPGFLVHRKGHRLIAAGSNFKVDKGIGFFFFLLRLEKSCVFQSVELA